MPDQSNQAFIIDDLTADGPTQMAVDHTCLHLSGQDEKIRLRFYQWSPPTLSLGYFQDYDKVIDQYPGLAKLPVVRRLTGGGAIFHDREITYCLTVPACHDLYRQGPVIAYRLVHQAVIKCARDLGIEIDFPVNSPSGRSLTKGPAFCFARNYPTDLAGARGKVAGSAQRRMPQGFLQHGSIFFENRLKDQPGAGLRSLTEKNISRQDFRENLAELIGRELGVNWDHSPISPDMQELVDHYRENLHSNENWICLGRKWAGADLARKP